MHRFSPIIAVALLCGLVTIVGCGPGDGFNKTASWTENKDSADFSDLGRNGTDKPRFLPGDPRGGESHKPPHEHTSAGDTQGSSHPKALGFRLREFEISRFDGMNDAESKRFGASRVKVRIFFTDEKTVTFIGPLKATAAATAPRAATSAATATGGATGGATTSTGVSTAAAASVHFTFNLSGGNYTLHGSLDDTIPSKTSGEFILTSKVTTENVRIFYSAYKAVLHPRTDRTKPQDQNITALKDLFEGVFGWVNNWVVDVPNGLTFYLIDFIKEKANFLSVDTNDVSLKGLSMETGDQNIPVQTSNSKEITSAELVGNSPIDTNKIFEVTVQDKKTKKLDKIMLDVASESDYVPPDIPSPTLPSPSPSPSGTPNPSSPASPPSKTSDQPQPAPNSSKQSPNQIQPQPPAKPKGPGSSTTQGPSRSAQQSQPPPQPSAAGTATSGAPEKPQPAPSESSNPLEPSQTNPGSKTTNNEVTPPASSAPAPVPAPAPARPTGASFFSMDSATPTSRAARMNADFLGNANLAGVKAWIDRFRGLRRDGVGGSGAAINAQRFFFRAVPFRSLIEAIGRQFDVLSSFALLTVNELPSYWDGNYALEQRLNFAGALGPFQILPGTAHDNLMRYDSRQLDPDDERRYFATSACGAARIVASNVDKYSPIDSTIAILAYNQGTGGAARALACGQGACGGRSISQYEDWVLRYGYKYKRLEPLLVGGKNQQLFDYVDKILALNIISQDLITYQFQYLVDAASSTQSQIPKDLNQIETVFPQANHTMGDSVCASIIEQFRTVVTATRN